MFAEGDFARKYISVCAAVVWKIKTEDALSLHNASRDYPATERSVCLKVFLAEMHAIVASKVLCVMFRDILFCVLIGSIIEIQHKIEFLRLYQRVSNSSEIPLIGEMT